MVRRFNNGYFWLGVGLYFGIAYIERRINAYIREENARQQRIWQRAAALDSEMRGV